jgi:hypothetical protein
LGGAFLGTAQIDTIKEVSKGVWFREAISRVTATVNNVVIEMKDYLVGSRPPTSHPAPTV